MKVVLHLLNILRVIVRSRDPLTCQRVTANVSIVLVSKGHGNFIGLECTCIP